MKKSIYGIKPGKTPAAIPKPAKVAPLSRAPLTPMPPTIPLTKPAPIIPIPGLKKFQGKGF